MAGPARILKCRAWQLVSGALAVVVLVGCSNLGSETASVSDDSDGAELDRTTVTSPSTRSSSETTSTEVSTTEPSDASVDGSIGDGVDVSDSLWVINGYDGLVDDQGRSLGSLPGDTISGARTVARAADGTLYFATFDNLWSLSHGDVDLAAIDVGLDPDWGNDLGYGPGGQVVVQPYADEPVELDDRDDRSFRFELDGTDSEQSITATNGLTVRVIDPIGDYDPEGGYLTNLQTPAKLEVLGPGEAQEWTVELGGSTAVWLSLVDFNGRFVMLARAPSEPADPQLQHIVYDLNCPHGGPTPTGGQPCTQTFWTQFGKASLVGPDLPPGESELNPRLPEICPTALTNISPPLEMTDDWFGQSVFTSDDREAFEEVAASLTTCDPLGLLASAGSSDSADGLAFEAGSERDGWLWTELARALDGPFQLADAGDVTAVWQRHAAGPAWMLSSEYGQPDLRYDAPSARPVGDIAVVRGAAHIAISGTADTATGSAILAAVNEVAADNDLEVFDVLFRTGPQFAEVDAAVVDEFVSQFVEAAPEALGQPGREVHLVTSPSGSSEVGLSPPAGETAALRSSLEAAATALSDVASGGDGAFDELPLAPQVSLALGSEVLAVRSRQDLAEPSSWTINDTIFRAYEDSFDVLDRAGGPIEIGFGVHPRCASPIPEPAPPELAQYHRVWIQPSEDSIDSCLQWSSVDLFIDDAGLIRGVSLDRWDP